MARPTKQGIDFFSVDCNFDDKTELFLMEAGPSGLGILVTVWQLIYSNNGYFIQYDEDLPLLIKRRVSGDINDINSVINLCISRGIFNKELFESHKILTSKAIQKRYFDAAKKKKLVVADPDFLLIVVSAYKNLVNVDGNPINSSGNATKEKEKEKEKEKVFTGPPPAADKTPPEKNTSDSSALRSVAPPQPPNATCMVDTWQPSAEVVELIMFSICQSRDYINNQLVSFTSHFHGQYNPNWDQKFKQWINTGWNVYGHKLEHNKKANADNRPFVEKHTDKTWRTGL